MLTPLKPDAKVIYARTALEINTIKTLFLEYQKELGRDLCFQRFDEELQGLPGKYARPHGELILLRDIEDDQFVGCIALKPLEGAKCEMKRLYVQPRYRSKKYGFTLVESILSVAQELSYEEIWLDTLIELKPAIRLYEKFGFVRTTPYYHNPFDDVVFMMRSL